MNDDSGLSGNFSKSVQFRLRVQQEVEANNEIKKYLDEQVDEDYYYKDVNEGKPI